MSGIRVPVRLVGRGACVSAVVVLVVATAACGGDDEAGFATLPPIQTTTTSSTTTTLVDDTTLLYTVKRGDNLSLIAKSFEVPLAFLIEENEDVIDDPNNVPPGVTLKIPPYRIVEELPSPSSPTSSTEAP